ncbi:MAG: monothiol glutaredoxin, Grx4 family [Rickettsiales bacterium]|nr:MAG: monothiol glutaredoxin, Grx4 family [Rickettsiales bacterium]
MSGEEIFDLIKKQISDDNVVLYMKGTADFPQCGFSAMVAGILQTLGIKFKDINILSDENLRQGVKDFSDWPTIPQLYINKEFVGGCDIVREMYENGELSDLLKKSQNKGAQQLDEETESSAGAVTEKG